MVATRHSLRTSPLPTKPSSPVPATDRKLKNALRKLQIDGNAALFGEQSLSKPPDVDVYHWRGTSYAVTKTTRPEWIENQPDRYKRRERAATAESSARNLSPNTPRSQPRSYPATRQSGTRHGMEAREGALGKRKRGVDDDTDNDAVVNGRRKRPMHAFKGHRSATSALEQPSSFSRSHRRSSRMETTNPLERYPFLDDDSDEEPNGTTMSSRVRGGHQSCGADHPEEQNNSRNEYNIGSPGDCGSNSTTPANGTETETPGRVVLSHLIRLARMNARVTELSAAYRENKANLYRAILVRRQSSLDPDIAHHTPNREEPSTTATRDESSKVQSSRVACLGSASTPEPQPSPDDDEEDGQLWRTPRSTVRCSHSPPAASPSTHRDRGDASSPIGVKDRPRHDSAATCTPTPPYTANATRQISPVIDETTASREESDDQPIGPNSPWPPTPVIGLHEPLQPELSLDVVPQTKHGQRWTLSSQLNNNERAEAHISRGRIETETAPSRRRRVRREVQCVRSWTVETKDAGSRPIVAPEYVE